MGESFAARETCEPMGRGISLVMLRRTLLLLIALPALLPAQTPGKVTVAVRVVDSAGAPVPDAEVTVVRDVAAVMASAPTNAAGRAQLSVVRSTAGALQLSVRKIGFQRGYQFFTLPAGDSMSLEMRINRSVASLAPVTVTAEEDLRRKSYHLGAEDIEKSTRTLIDATDVFKLRPDMLNSRGGAGACAIPFTQHNGSIENVWINGRHIALPIVDSTYVAGREQMLGIGGPPPRPNPRLLPSKGPVVTLGFASQPRSFSHIDTVLSILQGIKPEHIEEITYHDCFDKPMERNFTEMAMFITLKPGIGYREGFGTYVVADEMAAPNRMALDSLPKFRFRLLGVYDFDTGDPLAGVDIVEPSTGIGAKTSKTGTVSLFFVPPGLATVRLHLDGYRDTTAAVAISPADTMPITLTLTRRK
jgi:hypothetical protein